MVLLFSLITYVIFFYMNLWIKIYWKIHLISTHLTCATAPWSITGCEYLRVSYSANLYRFGARSRGACPFSHELCQNFVVFPLPRVTTVLAEKRRLSVASQGGGANPWSIW